MSPSPSSEHESEVATSQRNFLITDVVCLGDDSMIGCAGVWEDLGDMFATRVVMERAEILARIDAGDSFRTLVRNVHGDWKKGPAIALERIAGARFLKACDDVNARDSLGRLPATWHRDPTRDPGARSA